MSASRDPSSLVSRVANVPLFRNLSADALSRTLGLARSRAVAAGDFFFNEGDAADAFFVLTSGRVKLTQLTPEGHQIVLRLVVPVEAFGGAGTFGDSLYPVSAEVIQDAEALAWTSTTMRRVLEAEPVLALNALSLVASRLHDLQQRYRQAMTERVERRVARALLRLVRDGGRRVEGGVEIAFPVSRQDLAEMTGTTLFTVSRLLSGWERGGLVRSGRERITVTDPHGLVAIAEDLPRR